MTKDSEYINIGSESYSPLGVQTNWISRHVFPPEYSVNQIYNTVKDSLHFDSNFYINVYIVFLMEFNKN